MVVNLDPYHPQSGWVELDLQALGLDQSAPYQVHELLSDARYLWHGARNFVQLDPSAVFPRTSSACAAACAPSATSIISCDSFDRRHSVYGPTSHQPARSCAGVLADGRVFAVGAAAGHRLGG